MEFVSLLGNYVDSFKSLEDLQREDVITSYQIKIFIERYYRDFDRIHFINGLGVWLDNVLIETEI